MELRNVLIAALACLAPIAPVLASCGDDDPAAKPPVTPPDSAGADVRLEAAPETSTTNPTGTKTLADEAVLKGGYLSVSEQHLDGGGITLSAVGELFDSTSAPAKCEESGSGQCRIMQCTGLLPRGASPVFAAGKNVSAGNIDITSDSGAVTVATFEANGFYATKTSTTGTIGDGGTAAISAEGGDVPAFTSTTNLPPPLTVSAPYASTGSDFNHKFGDPLTVTFAAGGHVGDVEIILAQAASAGINHIRVRCVTPASAGTFVVPSEVMNRLAKAGTFQLKVASIIDKEQAAGDYRLLIRGEANALFLRGNFL